MQTEPQYPQLICPTCGTTLDRLLSAPYKCLQCKAGFQIIDGIPSLIPKVADGDLREDYEQAAIKKQCTAGAVGYISERHYQAMIGAFQGLLPPLPVGRLMLDVGCGHGRLSKGWAQQHTVVGVDFALNMLKLARQNGLKVYHADATALPFEDDQFDIALSAEVIQHFDDISSVLAGMVRVVKPGGSVLLSTINADSVVRRMYRCIRKILPIRHASSYLPILRSMDQLLLAALDFPIKVERIALVYFPFKTTRFLSMPGWLNRRLASNFAILFKKISR
jgi:2-polyprenyl-3-methyl-5-hydroxy-6-metoxy-1,4-benzoquinol methylase